MTLAFDAPGFHLTDPDIDRSPTHGSNEPWRAAQVESKSSQTAAKPPRSESGPDSIESGLGRAETPAVEEARPVAEKWVAVYLPRCGHKRMAAYDAVSRVFRCHESLVRRLLGRQVDRLDADLYKRIMQSEATADRLLIQRHEAELQRLGRPLGGEVGDAAR